VRRTEDNIFDNYEKKSRKGAGHFASAVVCGVMIAAIIGVLLWINSTLQIESGVVPDFQAAMDEGRYNDALDIYRNVHDIVVAADDSGLNEDSALQMQRAQMAQMEQIVNERLLSIEEQMRTSRYTPSTVDLRFMNEMGELTLSQISIWLNDLSTEFLLGTIEKPDLVFISSR
jgi:hypothetical protein